MNIYILAQLNVEYLWTSKIKKKIVIQLSLKTFSIILIKRFKSFLLNYEL